MDTQRTGKEAKAKVSNTAGRILAELLWDRDYRRYWEPIEMQQYTESVLKGVAEVVEEVVKHRQD